MNKANFLFFLLLVFGFSSCIDSIFGEMKQAYPYNDLNRVKALEFYDYGTGNNKIFIDSLKIRWYTDFLKDSSNYYRKESIDKERGEKPIYGLTFFSEGDTLDLTLYPARSQDKIVAAFLDPYDPNDHWKFRKYNRFYINDQLLDSLKADYK
ncbi:hypothetical protein [Flagellimonas sp.]|uniref:hypothetical protein n=1 Tax=Flagellimonas sp. TaxID=2058762 RepID=UPI003AB444BF